MNAGEAASGLAEEAFENARDGALTIGAKAIDAARTNSDASFALARDLFGARTMSEAIALQSAFARKQFAAVTAQMKAFQELSDKVIATTTGPVSEKVTKAFKDLNPA